MVLSITLKEAYMKTFALIIAVLMNGIIALPAEPVSEDSARDVRTEQSRGEVNTKIIRLVDRLNTLSTNGFSQGKTSTNNGGPVNVFAEEKEIVRVKTELASQGISVRWVNGQYIDATADAANGYSLNQEDQKSLAFLNYLEQNDGFLQMKKIPGFKQSGETRSRANALKRELTERGISVLWNKDKGLYIVTRRKGVSISDK